MSQTNGAAGTLDVTYNYGDMRAHVKGLGLLGFASMTVNNTTLGTKTETKVTKWDGTHFVPTTILTTTTIDGKESTSQTTNKIEEKSEWKGNYFCYCKEQISTDFYEHPTKTEYTYDIDNGVLTDETSYYDNKTDMYKSVSYSAYRLYAGKYLPQLVTQVQKHPNDKKIQEVENYYTYDDKGDVTKNKQTSTYNNKSITLTTTYERDPLYGKVLTESTTGDNVIEVKKCYQYDDKYLYLLKGCSIN